MVKKGFNLFAVKFYGEWIVKQAKSPAQFVRLAVKEQHDRGNYFNRRCNHLLEPSLVWSEAKEAWVYTDDGSVYGKKLIGR